MNRVTTITTANSATAAPADGAGGLRRDRIIRRNRDFSVVAGRLISDETASIGEPTPYNRATATIVPAPSVVGRVERTVTHTLFRQTAPPHLSGFLNRGLELRLTHAA